MVQRGHPTLHPRLVLARQLTRVASLLSTNHLHHNYQSHLYHLLLTAEITPVLTIQALSMVRRPYRKWRARQKRHLLLLPLPLPLIRHLPLDSKPSILQLAPAEPVHEIRPTYSMCSRLQYHHSSMVFKGNLSRQADLTHRSCTIIIAML